jgi:hypothetical protein
MQPATWLSYWRWEEDNKIILKYLLEVLNIFDILPVINLLACVPIIDRSGSYD